MPARIDRTGQTFGHVLILKELGNDKVWGRCLLCDDEKEYRKATLVNGQITSCGHHIRRGRKHTDCTGKTISNIFVVKDLEHNRILGRCLLCGTEKEFILSQVTSGKIQSCGCLRRKVHTDYTGQTFGNILILKELGHRKIWGRCLLCGKEKEFKKYSVIRGQAKSCGCEKK